MIKILLLLMTIVHVVVHVVVVHAVVHVVVDDKDNVASDDDCDDGFGSSPFSFLFSDIR